MIREPTLEEFVARCLDQDSVADGEKGDAAVLLVLDALRVGVKPTLSDLARSSASRTVWFQAARLLERERAQRRAFAVACPGVRLEEALAGSDDPAAALEAAVRATDERLLGSR